MRQTSHEAGHQPVLQRVHSIATISEDKTNQRNITRASVEMVKVQDDGKKYRASIPMLITSTQPLVKVKCSWFARRTNMRFLAKQHC